MNYAYLILDDTVNIPSGPVVLKSSQVDLDLKLADLSLQLDELIYFKKQQIDLAVVVKDQTDLTIEHECVADTVYFLSDRSKGSFYCRPEVLSVLSTLYKFNFVGNPDINHTDKMLHVLDKTGLQIHVK